MLSRILPLALFILLGLLLAAGLRIADTKTQIPSPLIGKPVPEFDLPMLYDPATRYSQEDFLGQPYLINFWASWCVTCVIEHPVIAELAKMGKIRIVGFNFRDEPEDARRWLARHGDPYDLHITDYEGNISIDFGVYAAPETFLINPAGEIAYKHIGALNMEVIEGVILPMAAAMEDQDG